MRKLTNENIKIVLEEAERFLRGHDTPRKSILSVSLRVENLLLFYRENLTEDADFSAAFNIKGSRPILEISIPGREIDPRDAAYAEQLLILKNLSGNPEEGFEYVYHEGTNRCRFILERKLSFKEDMLFAWKYIRKNKGVFFLTAGTRIASMALCVAVPILSAKVISSLTEELLTRVVLEALALLGVRFANSLLFRLCGIFANKVYCAVMTGLESDIAESVMDTELVSIERNGTGLFIERMTSDTKIISTGLNTLTDLSADLFQHIGMLIAMLFISLPAFVFMLIGIIVIGLIEKKRASVLEKNVREMRVASEKVSNLITEMVKGSTDIKALNMKQTFGSKLNESVSDSNRKLLKTETNSRLFGIAIDETTNVFSFLFAAFLVFLLSKGNISVVTALILFNYSESLGLPTVNTADRLVEFLRTFSLSCERVMSVINGPRFPKEKFGTKHIDRLRGDIVFDHVVFAYGFENPGIKKPTVIKNMSFKIKAGEKIAIVGKSGCGKSTVAELVAGLRTASSGRILLDGEDINELDRDTIRNNISLISQDPYMFNISVRENLKIVSEGISEEEMRSVMRQCCMDDDVMRMADGYDSVLGEDGITISGGQKQRIAIARALLRKTPIIIFDEATSALDSLTQKKVQQAIDHLGKEHTILIIAHRLSTIRNCDRIFYIEDGSVKASGPHDELVSTCESYRTLQAVEFGGDPQR